MSYKVQKSFYVGNDLHLIGEEFNSDNQEQIQELLADGNIAEGGSESTTPLADSSVPVPPQVPEQPPVDPTVAPQVQEPPVAVPQPQKGQPTPEQINQDLQVLENASNPSVTESEGEKPNVQIS